MNQVLQTIHQRKSVRAFTEEAVEDSVKAEVRKAILRAPTAGNMVLYSVIEVEDQGKKNTLAASCDNQPFIAKAPWVLIFCADMRRWYDYFDVCRVRQACEERGIAYKGPGKGDLFIAFSDAVIAAQNAVIAAESLGLGSCYIGDILENYETHKELLGLPDSVFPATMLVIGRPTEQQKNREQSSRPPLEYIFHKDSYRSLEKAEFEEYHRPMLEAHFASGNFYKNAENLGQHYYFRKSSSEFMAEMSRSITVAMKHWEAGE